MDFLLQSMEKMIFLHGKSFSPFFFAKTERILHVRRQMVHGRINTEKRRGKDAYEKSAICLQKPGEEKEHMEELAFISDVSAGSYLLSDICL